MLPAQPPSPQRSERGILWSALDGVAYGFLGETFGGLASLLASLAVLRLLSVYEFGLWQLAIALLGLVNVLSLSSVDRLVVAELARLRGERKVSEQHGLFVDYARGVIALGIGIGVIYAALVLPRFRGGGEFALTVMILASAFPVGAIKRVLATFFSAQLQFRAVAAMGAVEAGTYLLLILWVAFLMRAGLPGVAVAYVGAMAVGSAVLVPAFLREQAAHHLRGHGSGALKTLLRSYGFWSVFTHIVESASANAKPWLLARFLGIEALGLFMFARTFVAQIASAIPVPRILNTLLPYEFHDPIRFSMLSRRAVKYSLWLGVMAAGAAAACAVVLVELMLPKYASALPLLYAMLPVVVIGSMTFVFINVLYAARLQREFFYGTLFKPVSTFVILPLLLAGLGAWGAPLEYVLLSLVMLSLRYYPVRLHLMGEPLWGSLFTFDRHDRHQLARVQQWIRNQLHVGP